MIRSIKVNINKKKIYVYKADKKNINELRGKK